MKSSPDFQTGSILLLTATLICIGLAITVIAPNIDSPLAASSDLQLQENQKNTGSSPEPTNLYEFYPPVQTAHHETDRARQMAGTAMQQTSRNIVDLTEAQLQNIRLQNVSTNSRSMKQTVTATSVPPVATLPPGSVYAPITIQNPAPPAVAAPQESVTAVAERIERLVTERERMAAALELEKQRHSELAKQEQRRLAEQQQQQIARLEQEIKSLSGSLTMLQSETTTHLNRIAEDNQRLNMASEAIDVYREALRIATDRTNESLMIQQRSADATLQKIPSESRTQGQADDAGRVRIPSLPPMPTHQHPEPEPAQDAPDQFFPEQERPPQSAQAPAKRLRVSSPAEKPPEPEREPVFLPLPDPEIPVLPPARREQEATAVPTPPDFDSELEFTPLKAPAIREFKSSHVSGWDRESSSVVRVRTPPRIEVLTPPEKKRGAATVEQIPELNVAFEHTYEFRSKPVDTLQTTIDRSITTSTSILEEQRQQVVESSSIERSQSHSQRSRESVVGDWSQIEAIEITRSHTGERPNRLKPSASPLAIQSPERNKGTNVATARRNQAAVRGLSQSMQQSSRQSRTVATTAQSRPPITQRPQRETSQPSVEKKSWIEKVSGVFVKPGESRSSSTKAEDNQRSPSASRSASTNRNEAQGSRGNNRHRKSQPLKLGRLKLAIPQVSLRPVPKRSAR